MYAAYGISFSRGNRLILSNVSCELEPGRLTALIGANGAGKSTLFRMFAGELKPDKGIVAFSGQPLELWENGELAKRRAALPQENQLAFPFTVQQVVTLGRFPHSPQGETREDIAIAREALKRVDMQGFEERRFTTLSGGEKQRVQLARALSQIWATESQTEPCVLLLDEPTSNLDPAHQSITLAIAREAAAKGNAVLAILHDMNLALAYADQLWALQNGKLVANGPIEKTLTPNLARKLFGIDCQVAQLAGQARPQLVVLANATAC